MAPSESSSEKIGQEYGDVRASIDVQTLEIYLKKEMGGSGLKTPISVKQFKFGQSNPTYFLTDANNTRFVLRKKPAGQLLSSTAHQVEREFRVLRALNNYNRSLKKGEEGRRVPVPEVYLLCTDSSVLGTPFYVMEFLEGRIFEDVRLLGITKRVREELWLATIHALTALSSVDPVAVGLAGPGMGKDAYGPPTEYFSRQIKSFAKISSVQAQTTDVDTGEKVLSVPHYDVMLRWYADKKNLPAEGMGKPGLSQRIVHGDYKLDNLVFHPTENRVIGILDWELSTLGSPLADFANLTQPWTISPDHLPPSGPWKDNVKVFKGLPVREDGYDSPQAQSLAPVALDTLERAYCKGLGLRYPLEGIMFVRSWNLFRSSVIVQGIAARAARRQASSANAEQYAQSIELWGNLARRVLEDEGVDVEGKGKDKEKSKM